MQEYFQKTYGIMIDCEEFGSIYVGKPNTFGQISKKENNALLRGDTGTHIEIAYFEFMQLLSDYKNPKDIQERCQELLYDNVMMAEPDMVIT